MANTNTIEMKLGMTGTEKVRSDLNAVTGDVQRFSGSMQNSAKQLLEWVGIGAAIASVSYAMKQAVYDSAMLSARVETLGVVAAVTGRNVGISAAGIRDYTESIKKMGITTAASRDLIIRMNQSHLDLSKAQDLARVAQDAAVIGNINSSEATTRMIFGIQSAQVEVLRTIDINVNFETSYAKVAKQLGKTVETMTEAEKANIRMNAVLESGKNIAGSYEAAMGTVGKQLTSLNRYLEEVKLKLGEAFKPALGVVVQVIEDSLKEFDNWLTKATEDKRIFEWAKDIATGVIDAFWGMSKAVAYTWWIVEKGRLSFQMIKAASLNMTTYIQEFFSKFYEGLSFWTDKLINVVEAVPFLGKVFDVGKLRAVSQEYMNVSNIFSTGQSIAAKAAEQADTKLIKMYENQVDALGKIDAFYTKLNAKLTEFVKKTGEAQKEISSNYYSQEYVDTFNVEEGKKQLEKLKDLYKASGLEQYAEQARILNMRILQSEKGALAERTGNWETAENWIIAKDKEFWGELTGQSQKANAALIAQDKSAQQERIVGYMATAEKLVAITRQIEAGEWFSLASWNTPQATAAGASVGDYTGLPVAQTISTVTATQVQSIVNNAVSSIKTVADLQKQEAQKQQAEADAVARQQAELQRAYEESMKVLAEEVKAIQSTIDAQTEYAAKMNEFTQSYAKIGQVQNISGLISSIESAYGTMGLGTTIDQAKLTEIQTFFSGLTSDKVANYDPDKLVSLLGTWVDLTTKEYTARKQLINAIGKESNWRNKMLMSDLAPVQSKALYDAIYQQKLTAAQANPTAISDFTSFLESDYLPFMKAYMASGSDYKDLFNSIFNTGGVLDQIIGGSQSGDTEQSIEEQMNTNLGLIIENLNKLDLSDYAKLQVDYLSGLNASMASVITNTGDLGPAGFIKSNTFNTWAALQAITEATNVYKYGTGTSSQYYSQSGVQALLGALSSMGSGYGRVSIGGKPYASEAAFAGSVGTSGGPALTSVSQMSKDNPTATAIKPSITSLQEKVYNVGGAVDISENVTGGVSYRASYIDSLINAVKATNGKIYMGGKSYTATEIAALITGYGEYQKGITEGVKTIPASPLLFTMGASSWYDLDKDEDYMGDTAYFPPATYNQWSNVSVSPSSSRWYSPSSPTSPVDGTTTADYGSITTTVVGTYNGSQYSFPQKVNPGWQNDDGWVRYSSVTPIHGQGDWALWGYKRGGLGIPSPAGLNVFAEEYPEYAVPAAGTPYNKSFLQSVGADPDVIAERVASRISSTGNVDADRISQAVAKGVSAAISQSGGKTQIILQVGDKVFGDVLVDLLGPKAHKQLIKAVQRTAGFAN